MHIFRATGALIACVCAFGALYAGPAAGQDGEGWVDNWPGFVMLVWQYKTPAPGPEAKALYESVNLRGIHLDNGFSDELLRFAIDNNYRYYVDHTAGKGYLHLYRRDWREFSETYKEDRRRPVRPNCLRDPQVVGAMKKLIRDNVTRAREGPVVGYAFDDEISVTSFTTPADICWSSRCLGAFRDWLREQYGTVESLNAEWGTEYEGFDEAEPLHVDDLRSVHELPFNEWNIARWADHRSFMDTTFADLLAELTEYANELDPSAPAGFVGGQAPATYGGYDYAKLCEAVQWMEAYDIGCTNEILRSFFGQRKPHVQTYFSNYSPKRDKWFLWYYFVHGNRGVICWPDRGGEPWFDGGRARDEIAAMADTYGELQGELSELPVNAEFVHDRVAIYYSQPSIQASWFMDIKPHGSTWVNRSSSLNNSNATSIINRWAWVKLLEDCGVQYEFVSYRDVGAGRLSAEDYDVLILPRTIALSDGEADTIRGFVEEGGTVIADYLVGIFDEHCKGRSEGALDGLFGVGRDASKGVLDGEHIAEVNGELYTRPLRERLNHEGAYQWEDFVAYERGLRATTGEAMGRAGEADVVVMNAIGRGETVYLNITPIPYLLGRYGAGGEAYRQRMTALLGRAGIAPPVRVYAGERELANVERLLWRKGGREYLCLMWNALPKSRIDGFGVEGAIVDGAQRQITIRFSDAVEELRNVRTERQLGLGREFRDMWLPCEANIYEVVGR